MAIKKTKAEQIASIPIERIASMSSSDRNTLESYVKTLRTGYNRRVQSFANKGLISHAQIALEGSMPTKPTVQLTKLSRNQLILEFARYQRFFQSQTSTEKGIRDVNRAQDIRIFGADEKGKPRYQMTSQERELYWRLYEEYQNMEPANFQRYGYGFVQQQLGELVKSGDELQSDNFAIQLGKLSEKLAQEKMELDMRSVPNVYSGRGTTFKG